MDLYHLHDEAAPSDMSALDSVVDYIREELKKLEQLEEKIMTEVGPEDERLAAIYERVEELDPSTFEVGIRPLSQLIGPYSSLLLAYMYCFNNRCF
jgi:ATP-binding cassette subfamily F protein 2